MNHEKEGKVIPLREIEFDLRNTYCHVDRGYRVLRDWNPVRVVVSKDFYHALGEKSRGAVRVEILADLNLDLFWWKKGLGILSDRRVFLDFVEESQGTRRFLGRLERNDISGPLGMPRWSYDKVLEKYHYRVATTESQDLSSNPQILQFSPQDSPRNFFLGKLRLLLDRRSLFPGHGADLEIVLPLPYFYFSHFYRLRPAFAVLDHLAIVFPGGNLSLSSNPYYELHERGGVPPHNFLLG